VSGAQKHDVKLLESTLDHIVVNRPGKKKKLKQHLCADKGYSGEPASAAMEERHYIPHVQQEAKCKPKEPTLSGSPMGGRTDALVVEPLSKTACPV
jgi:hypothetical protein